MTAPVNTVAVQGVSAMSADNLNTYVQEVATVAALRTFIGSGTMTVYLLGLTAANDGGQGNFYWSPTTTGATDDGISTIIPTGVTTGAWLRLTTANQATIPCNASGTNVINLTPISDSPPTVKYSNYQLYSFVAASNSTGSVTAQFQPSGASSPLAALPVYLPSGTQAGNGSITAGTLYIIAYVSSLNANAGGFQIVSAVTASSVSTTGIVPQGRLTLSTGAPVMTADVTAATTIYYAPYVGNIVPIYNGVSFVNQTFSQLTLTTTAGSQLASTNYDVFVFLSSATATIGFGPAWTSATARGTGAGTTQLTQVGGLWVNANTMTFNNGATAYAGIAANTATYVGTVMITAVAGQMNMQFNPTAAAGGTNNFLSVWNAYNRVSTKSRCVDSTTSWVYSSTTIRAADGSNSNRVTWIDGLQQSFVRATYVVLGSANTNAVTGGNAGLGLNSTTTLRPGKSSFAVVDNVAQVGMSAHDSTGPLLGANFYQAVETGAAAGTLFTASALAQSLIVELDM